MLIFASEDVGLADPSALRVTQAAAAALERVGRPEGRFHLAQAAPYLATAPKSNLPWRTNVTARFQPICETPAGTARALATAGATSILTPTATTGWRSNTCRTPCREPSFGTRLERQQRIADLEGGVWALAAEAGRGQHRCPSGRSDRICLCNI